MSGKQNRAGVQKSASGANSNQMMDVEKLTKCLEKFSDMFMEKLAETMTKIEETNNLIQSESEKSRNIIDTLVTQMTEEMNKLRTKVKEMEKRIVENERRTDRIKNKQNLVIFGVKEETQENPATLENEVLKLIKTKLNVTIEKSEVDHIKRFGKAKDKKPIMLKLTTWKKKAQVLANTSKLKNTNIVIKEDIPKDIMDIRKKLYPKMKMYREQNRHAIIRYDKLYLDGKEVPYEDDETNCA
uniref:Transposase n=1 Tax=Cacopsylla melanoneura TaxID=428564 RepID=A0A8D8Q4Q5_9HEMI